MVVRKKRTMTVHLLAAAIFAAIATNGNDGAGVLPEAVFAANAAKEATPEVRTIAVSPMKAVGPIKPMHGVNNGPTRPKAYQSRSNFSLYKAARIPSARTHDSALYGGYGGSHVADISAIFPDFDKDENDPASYDFTYTDRMLDTIRMAGTEVFYRLGQSIEHGRISPSGRESAST